MTELRPYQLAIIAKIRDAIRAGHKRILVQLPTGAGKTLTAASMIASALGKGTRSLFAAHRLELIDQTVATFARLGILSLGVVRADDPRRDPAQPTQVCSVQTLARRRALDGVKLVFIDEAHRSCSKSYVKHLFEAYPGAIFVGLTATPCRTDGKPLGKFWTALVQDVTYSQLIAQGHLVEPLVYSTPLLPDLTSVRTVAGDYNAEDLEAAVNRRALIGNLLAEWLRHGSELRTVAFGVSVAHSRAIVEQFTEAGVRAEHLDGETPEEERRAILARLADGTTRVVSNVGVLTEGWDMPPCKCLAIACPTKSLVKYMQMAGRILRPWENARPVILDHGGNVDRHGMPHEDRVWSLEEKPKRVGSVPLKACPECFAMIAAAAMVCPHCGHVFPKPEPVAVPREEPLTHVELALRTLGGPLAQKLREVLNSESKSAPVFVNLVAEAEKRGHSLGWVCWQYKLRVGHPPPKKWTAPMRKEPVT